MTGEGGDISAAGHLWEAFARVADGRPDAPALVFPHGVLAFSALRDLAERAAGWLATEGARRGDVVAIQWPKRRETYALWLACLRQGCPYVFVDPRNPPARTEAILARLRPKLLATAGETVNPHGATLRLTTAEEGARWLEGLTETPPSPARPHGLDPAYIMFTSGSTGEPKGATIPHQGVLSLMSWARSLIGRDESLRFSNLNPLHFDNAVFDLYCGLVNGAALVPVETSLLANPAQWVRRLREGAANVIFAVPTLFQTLDRLHLLRPENLPEARVFLFGGEGFPAAPLGDFYRRFKDRARLINVYGPTETSCICSSIEVDEAALAAAGEGLPSLGRMHAGFDHAILDEDQRPVAPGKPGELWIGGANVGLGYYNHPEETARRFRQDPRQLAYRSIWYRTGDLAREDSAGLLWFVGRADNQVKIRGHRIELEEIDLAIEAFAGVSRAVAVVVAGADGAELHAAFSAAGEVSIPALRARLAARLPPYMQPARIVPINSLPQNANGKIDRKAVARLLEKAS
ncbi:MAG: amino acid adenylation domain-containing protein [Xanthobacteraceae bacterium]